MLLKYDWESNQCMNTTNLVSEWCMNIIESIDEQFWINACIIWLLIKSKHEHYQFNAWILSIELVNEQYWINATRAEVMIWHENIVDTML